MIIEIQKTINLKNTRKNITIKQTVHIDDISNPSQIINLKGSIIKNKCQVHLKNEGLIICNHPYELMAQLICNVYAPEIKEVGFLKSINQNFIKKIKTKTK